jgi:hypothetical protein
MTAPLTQQRLVDTLLALVTEIDLSFDYVNKDLVNSLTTFITNSNVETLKEHILSVIGPREEELFQVTKAKRKIKSVDYLFLDELVLFDDSLHFSLFKNENKNTKKTLSKYIESIYVLCKVLNGDQELPLDELQDSSSQVVVQQPLVKKQQQQQQVDQQLDGFLSSLVGNSDIMNIATEISADLQKEDFDPMSLLSSLLSGKPNDKLNSMVQNITEKIEHKINSGQVDKQSLEKQALNMLDAVGKSDLQNQMPNMLASLLKNQR